LIGYWSQSFCNYSSNPLVAVVESLNHDLLSNQECSVNTAFVMLLFLSCLLLEYCSITVFTVDPLFTTMLSLLLLATVIIAAVTQTMPCVYNAACIRSLGVP